MPFTILAAPHTQDCRRRVRGFFCVYRKEKHLSFKTGAISESFWTQNNSSMARYLAKITPLS